MLIIGFIRAFFAFAQWVTAGLPAAELGGFSSWLANIRDFWSVVLQVDAALPVHEMIDAAFIYGVLVYALGGQAVLRKLWNMIPVVGGGGA